MKQGTGVLNALEPSTKDSRPLIFFPGLHYFLTDAKRNGCLWGQKQLLLSLSRTAEIREILQPALD